LQLRRDREDLFRNGSYIPLRVTGEHANRLCAYARRRGQDVAVVLVPRLYKRLLGDRDIQPLGPEVWTDTAIELPRTLGDTPLQNIFDGVPLAREEHEGHLVIRAAAALANFPVALLAQR
jgi:(1->4)-alpha-D-glucan 1-alpha-D-glucosylmutase